MQSDLISIITPMYNGARFIARTIDSVIVQTYPNWEMIIVDDGSKDNSPEIVNDYVRRDPRIHLIRKTNGGSASARNMGLKASLGRYVCFLDSDDLWLPEMLEQQISL